MADKTDLQRMKEWLETYPGRRLLDEFQVDYTDRIPSGGAIFPNGLVEIARTFDICGNVTVQNQYNFGLYYTFAKGEGDAEKAMQNADWLMDFQRWAQEQSLLHRAPTFGNVDTRLETLTAQNGMLYSLPTDETATYMVQLSAKFKLLYESEE